MATIRTATRLLAAASLVTGALVAGSGTASAAQSFCSVSSYFGSVTLSPGSTYVVYYTNFTPDMQGGAFIQDGQRYPMAAAVIEQERGSAYIQSGAVNPTQSTMTTKGYTTLMYKC